jgi:hypothetical protein
VLTMTNLMHPSPHLGTSVPMLAMNHQFCCNMPIPESEAGEHVNENSTDINDHNSHMLIL